MKQTFFSKNEMNYLKNKREMLKKYPDNYIYQLRATIKHKIGRMGKDIEKVLFFNKQNSPNIDCKKEIRKIIRVLLKHYRKLIASLYKKTLQEERAKISISSGGYSWR